MTVEDFIKSTPYISEEGAVTLGSKKTTVFVLEAKTGRLIRTYRSPESSSTLQSEKQESASYMHDKVDRDVVNSGLTNTGELQNKEPHLLFVTRTDYTIQSFSPNSDKISWSMMVAEVGYAFLCRDIENPFITATMNTSYELGPEIGHDFDMPFTCQSKGVIQRFRKHDNSVSSGGSFHDASMLPLPAADLMLPSQSKLDRTSNNPGKPKILLASAPDSMLPLQPKDDKLLEVHHNDEGNQVLALPPLTINFSGVANAYDVRMPYSHVLSKFLGQSTALFLIFLAVVLFAYHNALVTRGQSLLNGHLGNLNSRTAVSKRKKVRKSGKSAAIVEKKDRNMSSENEDGFAQSNYCEPFMDLNKLVDNGAHGRRVGKLFVSHTEIAKGSNGTIVLEGIYEGRPVAVKRLVRAHHDVAFKEIQNLIASDRHPNIVRWYGVENDQDFVYLSLERCMCSLDELIQINPDSSRKSVLSEDQATRDMIDYKLRLDSMKGVMKDLNLWKANGHPSPLLLKLMRFV